MNSDCRHFKGQNAGPATLPDASRLQEAVILRLLDLLPTKSRVMGRVVQVHDLVIRAFERVRTLVMGCPQLTVNTNIQLTSINNNTLKVWYEMFMLYLTSQLNLNRQLCKNGRFIKCGYKKHCVFLKMHFTTYS